MNNLYDIIGVPFGYLMSWIYDFVGNYGVAIILFTIVTKLLLVPVNYHTQKSSARMLLLNPKLEKLRKSYANNPDYATQIDKIYAELYPDAPSVKAQLSGSVRTSEKADDGGKTASGAPRNRDAAADWVMKHSRAAKRRIS